MKTKTYTLKIVSDNDPVSPREWDNIGIMALNHKRYNLPCEVSIPFDELGGWDEVKEYLKKEYKAINILPVQGYDHSQFSIYIGSKHDYWDGGQLGFIFTTREQLKKMGTPFNSTKITKYLTGEVETYNQYLNGDVYGYIIEDEDGNRVDSCYGFFGKEFAEEEGNQSLIYHQKEEQKKHEAKLKQLIKHKVSLIKR